nr:IS66 family transposase [Pseudenhygromyxa sp. WMMC2535]
MLETLGRRTANLEFELMRLRKSAQGRKSERLDADQLDLFLRLVAKEDKAPEGDEEGESEDGAEAAAPYDGRIDAELDRASEEEIEAADQCDDPPSAEAEPEAPKTRGRRRPPEHLPVEKRIIEPDLSDYEGREMVCIGSVDAHTLDWRPGHFIHVHTERRKYAPRDGDGPVVIAPPPPQVIIRGLAEAGLLAHVIVSKYGDHLPLNRLVKIFARAGVKVTAPTMVGWLRRCAELLEPLVNALGQEVREAYLLQTDDTGIQVLDVDADGGSKRGHIWGYLGDQRLAYFEYTPNWKADAARNFLMHREGPTQADAYKGYDWVFNRLGSKAVEIGCWAHARRYFVEALEGGDARAAVPLRWIQRLYVLERKAKERGISPEKLAGLRNKLGRPELNRIFRWIAEHHESEPPSSPLARAMTYAINQREALIRYLDDGLIPIDNTGAERALRGIAVGRHNWLFAGSDSGGERAAIMYSLIRTCELNGVEPWEYLRDVLMKLAQGWPAARVGELLPHRWAGAQTAT